MIRQEHSTRATRCQEREALPWERREIRGWGMSGDEVGSGQGPTDPR
jgi:hypothetical protein